MVAAGAGALVYRIDANGALHLVPGSPVAAGIGPNGVSIDPTDAFVYIVNAASDNVSAYRFYDQSGKLEPVAGSPFPAAGVAAGITTAPSPIHE